MKNLLLATALFFAVSQDGLAQSVPPCPPTAVNCTVSNQHQGDQKSDTSNSQSSATQSNPSSNSNASGVDINATYDNRAQTTQNATTTAGDLRGGDSSATGNRSDNRSAASNGDQTMGQSNTGNSSVGNTSAAGGAGGVASSAAQGGTGGSSNAQGGTAAGGTGGASSAHGGSVGNLTTGPSTAAARQGQRQGQSIGNTSASGGASTSGGNVIDASTRSVYNNRTTFIPSVVPGTAPTMLAGSNVVVTVGTCGPKQTIVRTPVQFNYFGLMRTSSIVQGYDEALAPAQDQFQEIAMPDGSRRIMGEQPIFTSAVIGIGAGRNLAVGLGRGGDWGQAGGGASSSMQQIVTRIQLRECEFGVLHPPVQVAKPISTPIVRKTVGKVRRPVKLCRLH